MYAVILAMAALPAAPVASSPSAAVRAAYYDAVKIHPKDRIYYRYLWWNTRYWKDVDSTVKVDKPFKQYELLTRSQLALLSSRKVLPQPVIVCPGLLRIDTREVGWDLKLGVWEKFLGIDFTFHDKVTLLEDATFTVYYPPAYYLVNTIENGKVTNSDSKWYDATYEEVVVKKGQSIFRPKVTVNPLVEVKPGVMTPGQDELRKILNTEVPILWGIHWFVRVGRQQDINNTITGVGYYEWYGIKNRDDFFKLTGTDKRLAIKLFQVFQAYLDESGISQQERQIILLRGTNGLVWGTLDVITQKGRGQPGRNLRLGEFIQDGEEWIGKNPLGLPINIAVQAKDNNKLGTKAGDLLAFAPPEIGGNKSALNTSNNPLIHVGDTCWDCHGTGKGKDYLVSFDDWVRKNVRRNKAILKDPDKNVTVELESAYMDDIYRQLKRDREDFAFAIARLTSTGDKDPGMTVPEFTNFYRKPFYDYIQERVTVDIAADEMGVPSKVFIQRLKELNDEKTGRGALDPLISNFLLGNGMRRLAWEDTYSYAMTIAYGANVPELIEKVKK